MNKIIQFFFKMKVSIFLKGGNKVVIYVKSFESTRLSIKKERELSWEGLQSNIFTVDVEEIQAIEAKQVFKISNIFYR